MLAGSICSPSSLHQQYRLVTWAISRIPSFTRHFLTKSNVVVSFQIHKTTIVGAKLAKARTKRHKMNAFSQFLSTNDLVMLSRWSLSLDWLSSGLSSVFLLSRFVVFVGLNFFAGYQRSFLVDLLFLLSRSGWSCLLSFVF